MTSLFSAVDYDTLASIVFRPDYPGNATAQGIIEAPHGDGALDNQKKYSHVASKYLDQYNDPCRSAELNMFFAEAHDYAVEMAEKMGVPSMFWPSFEHGALRVLEYPVGATSAEHTDFDLFTLNLYRNVPNDSLPSGAVHMGELGELLGMGPATPHSVAPLPVVQRSIVYFAIPDHAVVLPSGETVGSWIQARMKRSRYEV